MPRKFLEIHDMTRAEAHAAVARAIWMKQAKYRSDLLEGRTVALIFEKASTRTRVSFEMAVRHLGGSTIYMTQHDSQLGRSEPVEDTIRVLSRYVDGLVMRTFEHSKLTRMWAKSSIPIVNALSDDFHPCQVLGDVMTMTERGANLEKTKVAWVGDGNNMANSWINAAAVFGFELALACPEGYDPMQGVLDAALAQGARVSLVRDTAQAVKGAHFVNTDVWASMGQESEAAERMKVFESYRVDAAAMALAAPGAKFMHCLPAHQGEEVTAEVFESPASIVWDQAENRLHIQKAILEWVYSGQESNVPYTLAEI
ncbi:Ornithine carbamoyltransferase [Fundidesulfovibrio magnetotacticus]|uniref:Ornithine carbamoyltransferase n=1 Tax=Fundidesulfovibrio magnetotacticus TaxID=2730080 RepID=A0A6V8LYL0_9BACT|nr:ornithine carbamoyltransferase [Fundidesulfovibrio magnetotacticus]GFK95109.1 Ornithine carbamoyltransferase [Fundidesulfovibrio magnetotacticus]